MPTADTDTVLRCEECAVAWSDAADRWRADWVDNEDGVRVWCPTCWLRGFGSD
jgi:hypothetical protein